mgnify:CR=1 FL=1
MKKEEILQITDVAELLNELKKPENSDLCNDDDVNNYFWQLASKVAVPNNPDIVSDPREAFQ